jgi:hypothetical protein
MPVESPTEKAIAELHAWYCERTRLRLRLCFSQTLWFDRLRDYKYDEVALRADCDLIVRYLKKEIARDKRNLGALKLMNFLQPDNFDADLAIAKMSRGSHTKDTKVTREEPAPASDSIPDDDPRWIASVAKLREFRHSLGRTPS